MLAEFLQSSENHIKILVALYKVSDCGVMVLLLAPVMLIPRAILQAAVREVDSAIGVLINTLKQIGIEHNTLIVYTSDHGSMLGSHGLMWVKLHDSPQNTEFHYCRVIFVHCARGKSTLYEEAVRVPLLMKLPHVIPADTKIKHPVTLLGKFQVNSSRQKLILE